MCRSRFLLLAVVLAGLVSPGGPTPIFAEGEICPLCPKLRAVPFVFVGAEGECGEIAPGVPYPAGSRIVTAAWLGGMGLPDNGGDNVGVLPFDNPNKHDPHKGLLLNKNGTTPDCSASGARIVGVEGRVTGLLTEIGFDYRNGGHCGAGATRFNVVVLNSLTGTETFHFVGGCANDLTPAPAPQDPLQWTRVRFTLTNPAEAFPVIPPGSVIRSISLLHDEGTDTPTPQSPNGVGLAVLDNIWIIDQFIKRGVGVVPHPLDDGDGDCDNDGMKDEEDWDDDNDGMGDEWDADADNDGITDAEGGVSVFDKSAILNSFVSSGRSSSGSTAPAPIDSPLLLPVRLF